MNSEKGTGNKDIYEEKDLCQCKKVINAENWEQFWETPEGQRTEFWTEQKKTKVTINKLEEVRKEEWKKKIDWKSEETDRIWKSSASLPEDIQNFEVPSVIIGCDIETLYPSLDKKRTFAIVYEEVMRSTIKWEDLDFLEGTRQIALNRSSEYCRNSPLRRVLPVIRKRTGTRPEVRGAGPMRAERGDQEQRVFPTITLSEKEKQMIVAEVTSIVTKVMFNTHPYTFGGKTFLQKEGGPIGLRGTGALARLVMCAWDRKWNKIMLEQNILVSLYTRYMDDGRLLLPPIRNG